MRKMRRYGKDMIASMGRRGMWSFLDTSAARAEKDPEGHFFRNAETIPRGDQRSDIASAGSVSAGARMSPGSIASSVSA